MKTLAELRVAEANITDEITRFSAGVVSEHVINWLKRKRANVRGQITKLKKNEATKYKNVGATQKRIEAFTRKCLKDLVAQLPDDQRAFFFKLYPEGIGKLALAKVPWAIEQCERTIAKNLYR